MAITRNKGSGVLLLGLLALALLIYNVPGLESFFFGLPLLAELAIIVAFIFGVAVLVAHLKRQIKQGGGRRRRKRG
ncbi:MAG: hypothetical protein JW751_12410 [Polyangiaceae bacterium]|nr:hypothetical protein [Polyangiaceae bacterium]